MEDHPTASLPAFALDCLDPGEFEQIRQHLAGCADCRAELSRFEQTCAELSHAVPLAEPPASLKPRLLSAIRSGRTFSWFEQLMNHWPRLLPTIGLATLALAILFGVGNLVLIQQLQHFNHQDLSRLQLARLLGTPAMPTASGMLLVTANDTRGELIVSALQPLEQSEQYQLWLIKDGLRTSGGVFSVSAKGEARLTVTANAPLDSYDAFGITIEPYGGSPGPTGQKVLGGSLAL